jgi:hypothetical protein
MQITVTNSQHATNINQTQSVSFKKTGMNDLSICKILARQGLHMNFNDICGTDVFLIESCPTVVQALCLLSFKFTLGAYPTEMSCIRILDIFHFRTCFFHRGK